MSNKKLGTIVVAVGMIIAGSIIALIGRAFGGSFKQNVAYNINNGIFRIIYDEDIDGPTFSNTKLINETSEVQGFRSLVVETTSIDIQIVRGPKYQIEYNVPEIYIPEIFEGNGTLFITQPSVSKSGMNITIGDLYYKITVPSYDEFEAEVASTSGDISISGVNFRGKAVSTSGKTEINKVTSSKLDLNGTSGSIDISKSTVTELTTGRSSGSCNISDLECTKLEIGSTSGSADLNKVKTHDLKFKSTSGSIDSTDLTADNITVAATSGSVKLELNGSESDYGYDISSTSGSIEIGSTKSSNSYQRDNHTDKLINVDTTSGSTHIRFK